MRVFLAAKDAPRIRRHPRRGGLRLIKRHSKGEKNKKNTLKTQELTILLARVDGMSLDKNCTRREVRQACGASAKRKRATVTPSVALPLP